MLIGADVTCFAGVDAGVSRYLREMLASMMAACPDDDYVLYSPVRVDVPLPPGRWRLRFPQGSLPLLPGQWVRHVYPRMLAEDRPDVFWGQNAVIPLGLLSPCPRVLTVHDVTSLLLPNTLYLGNRVTWLRNFRAALHSADRIVADSRATARLLRDLMGTPWDRLTVIHAASSRRLHSVSKGEALAESTAFFGLPDRFILTVGTLEPRKDHATLLAALRLRRDFPLLAIVGAVGWRSRGILRMIRAAESEGRVRYLGRVSDAQLAVLYGAAMAMVYPSLYEGFGLPVVEAMACGCPVLCTWSSSLPEVGGDSARYFRPHDAADLAAQLNRMVFESGRLDEMSASGRVRAAQFSFERAGREMLSVLRSAVCAR